MLDRPDFLMKQIIVYVPSAGDKLTFKNDNLVVKDSDGKIKVQVTCYRIFLLFVVGDTTITTGILSRSKKFGFSICLMNRNMKVYRFIASRMEGNTLLRRHQYEYNSAALANHLILNKIINQRDALKEIRNKNELIKEAIEKLNSHIEVLKNEEQKRESLLGIEGSAARVYFPQMFDNIRWMGRKPRIKPDFVNASLDIGYTILFNIIDALLNVYGFDEYCGVLHTNFYMRKSLVCDIVEPFRPIIDYATRKAINLNQIKEEDFKIFNGKYVLEWKMSSKYTQLYLTALMDYKEKMFLFVQGYYRAFMKQKEATEFPLFLYKGEM